MYLLALGARLFVGEGVHDCLLVLVPVLAAAPAGPGVPVADSVLVEVDGSPMTLEVTIGKATEVSSGTWA